MVFTPHLAQLAYASVLRAPIPRPELERLLSEWRIANARRAITGLLVVHGRACFQVLEGFPDAVEALMARIALDPRHQHVVRLLHRQLVRRRFGDWSMKLARAAPYELATISGLEGLEASCGRFHMLAPDEAARLVDALSRCGCGGESPGSGGRWQRG